MGINVQNECDSLRISALRGRFRGPHAITPSRITVMIEVDITAIKPNKASRRVAEIARRVAYSA
jgi:hypothetical protein